MRLCKPSVGNIESIIYCVFIVVFLSMNNVRPLFLIVEFLFIFTFILHYFRFTYKLNFMLVWSVLWLFICFLSILFSRVQRLVGCLAVTQMMVIINLIYPLMHDDEKYFRWFLNCYWAAAAMLLVRQLVTAGFDSAAWGRLGGDFGYNANYVGFIGAYAGILSGFNFFYFRKKYGLLQLVVSLVIVFLSGSRTSLAVIVIGVAFELLCEIRMSRNCLVKVELFAICIFFACFMLWLCFNVPLFYEMLGVRIEGFISTLLGKELGGSDNIRFSMMSEGMEVFFRHPILGIGIANSGFYSVYGTYFHNNYVEVLADTGIIGFIVYYSFWFVILILTIQSLCRLDKTDCLRHMLFCSIGIIIASLVGDIGTVSYFSENNLMVYPALFYMVQRCRGQVRLKEEKDC